jgi:hypothetical protein
MIKRICFLIFVLIFCHPAKSVTDSIVDSSLVLSAYAELYYGYDFSNPQNHNRPDFVYSHNRHNEVNLNLGYLKASYRKQHIRANVALMAGTYVNANLASEPGTLKNIFESNVGVKISKSHNVWIDAGVFNSHIGFESAVGKECWTLTRSMMADNSPYYETGVKITYTDSSQKWTLSALVLNGWQRIQRLYGNNTPSFGHQLVYKPNAKWLFNSSSFIGSDTPDAMRLMRYFHNFYTQFSCSDKCGIIVAFDYGMQQSIAKINNYFVWYSPVFIFRYAVFPKMNIALRGEYYSDKNKVIISNVVAPNGFNVYGCSVNMDYKLSKKAVWRVEAKQYISEKDATFIRNNKLVKDNLVLTTALAVWF